MAEPTIATILQAIFTLTFLIGFLPLLTSLWHFCQLERRSPSYGALHHRWLRQTKLPARNNKDPGKNKDNRQNWKTKKKKKKQTQTYQSVMTAFQVDWCVERALHSIHLRLWQVFPTLFTKAHQVREKQQPCHGNEGGRGASTTAPLRRQPQQRKIFCSQPASSLYIILMPLTFLGIHTQNRISMQNAKDNSIDERKEISHPMATTWLKLVNFSLWPYVLHYAMQFYHAAAAFLQENFLRFHAGTIMQDQGTNTFSSSIT